MVAELDMVLTQGEDWSLQTTHLDDFDDPMPFLAHPARMDIKDIAGGTLYSLMTTDELDPVEIPSLVISIASGTIQYHIPRSVSENFNPGAYDYDLWVTADDGDVYAGNQVTPVLRGRFIVEDRVTEDF